MTLKNRFFEIPQEESTKIEHKNSSELFISKYLSMHYRKIKSLSDDLLRLPAAEEFFFLQTDNSFNAFTFIPLVAKAHGIQELYASTYSINMRVIDSLVQMYDGGLIEKVTLMVSDGLMKRNPTTYNHLTSLANNRANFNVQYSWNHSKVCIMKTADDYFIIEGSGNWSENAFHEQYLFANCKALFDFRKELFTHAKLKTL